MATIVLADASAILQTQQQGGLGISLPTRDFNFGLTDPTAIKAQWQKSDNSLFMDAHAHAYPLQQYAGGSQAPTFHAGASHANDDTGCVRQVPNERLGLPA